MKTEKRIKYEDSIVRRAMKILETRTNYGTRSFLHPDTTKQYVQLKIGARQQEIFLVMFLSNQNKLLAAEEMFYGTIDAASVWPREIIKRALEHNAAALIFAHNHPSGSTNPSERDRALTTRLIKACDTVDLRVLDHVIVTANDSFSFAEKGVLY